MIESIFEFLKEIDTQLFLFFNGLHVSWLDEPMHYMSRKYNWVPFYAFLLVLVFIKYRVKGLLVMLFVLVMITLTDQISDMLKYATARYRPSHNPELEDVIHLVRDRRGGRFGFVSAHAANSFALALFLIHLLRDRFRWIVPLMLIWAGLKAYNRLYLGAHYPSDILGGIFLGLLVALMMIELWKYVNRRFFPEEPAISTNVKNNR